MPLRYQLLLFLLLLYGALVALLLAVRPAHPALFVAGEAVLLASLGLAGALYRGLLQPVRLLEAGTAALQAQDFTLKFQPVGQPELDRLIAVYNQMLAALRQERIAQQEQSTLLQHVLAASPAGVLLLDFDERVASANAAAARALGQPAATLPGQAVGLLPAPWGEVLANLAPSQPQLVRLPDGQTYRAATAHFFDRGFTRRFVVLEELTQEMRAQEKQTYEQLVRLVAHEVNNSIGAVNSLLGSFAHYAPQLAPPDQADFQQGLAVSRARLTELADFVGCYARLVRLPPPAPHPLDLHALLRDLGQLLTAQSIAQHITWHWELAGEGSPLLVEADSQQLTQALLNVAKNALEAIGPAGGNVWVRTTTQPPALVLENDGPPLTPAVSQRLFTPFFSTKPGGQGIGLVLVRDILLAHDLAFRLETTPAGRTAFWVGWPAT